MKELYLFAFANAAMCGCIWFISLCRLNAMKGPVLRRVRSEYAVYVGCAIASCLQPLWGEWPRWGSLAMAAGLLVGLLCSARAWQGDTTPAIATDLAPLGDK